MIFCPKLKVATIFPLLSFFLQKRFEMTFGVVQDFRNYKEPIISKNRKKPISQVKSTETPYKPRLIWTNIISITLFHLLAASFFIFWPFETRIYTWIWGKYAVFSTVKLLILWTISVCLGFFLGGLGGFGVTGGAHRLWTHRSYKARWPLRLILILCYSVAGQVCMVLVTLHYRNLLFPCKLK